MKKLNLLLFLTVMAACLTGCGATKTTTTKAIDGNGNPVETVTDEPVQTAGFFESGNLAKHYESEDKRIERYNALAMEKINFVKEQGVKRQAELTTPTERALSNVVDTLLVAQIPAAPPPSNIPPPKTMADVADKNLLGVGNLILQAYGLGLFGDIDRPQNDSSVTINNSGLGDVFFHSDNNKNPTYSVAGESSGYWDLGLNRGGDLTQIDRSNDSSSHSLW